LPRHIATLRENLPQASIALAASADEDQEEDSYKEKAEAEYSDQCEGHGALAV
jgi:hypothetical protein